MVAMNEKRAGSIKNIIANNSPAVENLENIIATTSTDAKANIQENNSAKTTNEQVTSPDKHV